MGLQWLQRHSLPFLNCNLSHHRWMHWTEGSYICFQNSFPFNSNSLQFSQRARNFKIVQPRFIAAVDRLCNCQIDASIGMISWNIWKTCLSHWSIKKSRCLYIGRRHWCRLCSYPLFLHIMTSWHENRLRIIGLWCREPPVSGAPPFLRPENVAQTVELSVNSLTSATHMHKWNHYNA